VNDALDGHKKLNEIKFHAPDKWEKMLQSNKGQRQDTEKSVKQEHLGYSFDGKHLSESYMGLRKSPLAQSAKAML